MTLPEAIDLRCGDWREVLTDVGEVDAVITDPPYGERTHSKQMHGRRKSGQGHWATSKGLGYKHLTPADAIEFSRAWGERCRGWMAVMMSHDLVPHHTAGAEEAGRYVFAPVPAVMRGMNVRLAGDGPSSWCVWILVSRPRSLRSWGTLPGAYQGNPFDKGQNSVTGQNGQVVIGAKPRWLMRAIIGDYTNPGDTVVDPCAGGGTTLLAAAELGCKAIGAEIDPDTYEKARKRLSKGYTPLPHPRAKKLTGKPKQGALW